MEERGTQWKHPKCKWKGITPSSPLLDLQMLKSEIMSFAAIAIPAPFIPERGAFPNYPPILQQSTSNDPPHTNKGDSTMIWVRFWVPKIQSKTLFPPLSSTLPPPNPLEPSTCSITSNSKGKQTLGPYRNQRSRWWRRKKNCPQHEFPINSHHLKDPTKIRRNN